MKPIIKYEATKLPLAINKKAIVRKKTDKNYINWIDKTELTNFVDQLYVPPQSDCYMCIICQCGTNYSYANKDLIPESNFTCSCGRKVIEYGN